VLVHPEITPPSNFYHFRDTTGFPEAGWFKLCGHGCLALIPENRTVHNWSFPRYFPGWEKERSDEGIEVFASRSFGSDAQKAFILKPAIPVERDQDQHGPATRPCLPVAS